MARHAGRTHALYMNQLRQWFAWCESNSLDPLVGVQHAHVQMSWMTAYIALKGGSAAAGPRAVPGAGAAIGTRRVGAQIDSPIRIANSTCSTTLFVGCHNHASAALLGPLQQH